MILYLSKSYFWYSSIPDWLVIWEIKTAPLNPNRYPPSITNSQTDRQTQMQALKYTQITSTCLAKMSVLYQTWYWCDNSYVYISNCKDRKLWKRDREIYMHMVFLLVSEISAFKWCQTYTHTPHTHTRARAHTHTQTHTINLGYTLPITVSG